MSRKSKKQRFKRLCDKYVDWLCFDDETFLFYDRTTTEDKLLVELIRGVDLDILYINSMFRNRFKRRLKVFKIIG